MLKNVLYFDSMLTPKIITILYWLSLFGIIVSGILAMFGSFFIGVAIIIGGGISSRIGFEMIMIVFKNNEYLKRIAEKP
ncbi:DUF4282 domain-containing protein [Yersinia kristensenii]|uniref:DUF4282 domain-containing protein n=1 Tax=Yersinia kristensenii TaxID=28152 RepID=UPI0005E50470|nr:DUF4282 domain-containing protein [Yersinia kristensenii]MBW5826405.1 DUF4282 domain-containing protein [Yersinia kristensenii]CNH18981.1 Uncharacterised protein [Yersinia kristensenii]CNK87576.1 Uncharacterised protein [Yersinia kristensenii]